ncbi:MAG: carboxymuconolactone decarboxylase family protein [Corynebacterium sp.]|nr:carboxymuconolactone decarboxylase family protein [Corynebacterium sp.]
MHPLYIDKVRPDVNKAMNAVFTAIAKANREVGLDKTLTELVNLRCSQMNACPTCLSVHMPKARKVGVPQIKIDLLDAWRTAEIYTPEERAALRLAESLTICPNPADPPAEVAQEIQTIFTPEQVAMLQWQIIAINAANRTSIGSDHPVRLANYA